MKLRDWLDSSGKTPEWLADQLGRERSAVRRWLNGSARPRYAADLQKIEEITEGKVTASDVLLRPVAKRRVGRPTQAAGAA